MRNRFGIALIAAMLASVTACHKDDKGERLKALDSAYASGVFTREEYEAKKRDIQGTVPPSAAAPTPAPAPAVTTPAGPPEEPPAVPPLPTPKPAVPKTTPHRAALPSPPPPPPRPAAAPKSDAAEAEPAPAPGCEDADYRGGGRKSMERVFSDPPAAVHKAAIQALEKLDFSVRSDDGHEIEASKRRHLSAVVGAGGERVILHIANSRVGTRVNGETRTSFVGRLAQKSWTSAVLAQMACNLHSVR